MTDAITERMPTLYIGHGAPPLLDDPVWSSELITLAADIPRPKAILVVSAHWEAAPLSLSATAAATPLVYDFGGFDERYYRWQYRTPDAAALATKVTSTFSDVTQVHQHPSRGLDHGAWVPISIMYPEADIPILQLSLPTNDPDTLMAIGKRLNVLRDEGVLIMGSGFLTHGLPFLREFRIEAAPPGWSVDFDLWAAQALADGDIDRLSNFYRAPGMPYAHPTVEHLTPLFVAVGAADDPGAHVDATIDGYWMGLSKRSYLFN